MTTIVGMLIAIVCCGFVPGLVLGYQWGKRPYNYHEALSRRTVADAGAKRQTPWDWREIE